MAESACPRCDRDTNKAALVRCRDSACPLKATPDRASPVKVAGALAGGAAVIAVVLFLASGATQQPKHPPKPTATLSSQSATATASDTVPGSANAGSVGWLDWLFKAKQSVVIASDAGLPTDDAPDPRAASRVQSFSCEGRSSRGRALICTHWSLAITDYNVALLYQEALSRSANPRALARARRAWIARIDKHGTDTDTIQSLYEEWRAQLSKITDRTR